MVGRLYHNEFHVHCVNNPRGWSWAFAKPCFRVCTEVFIPVFKLPAGLPCCTAHVSGTVNNNKTRDFLPITVGSVKNSEEPETVPYSPANRKLAEYRRYLGQMQTHCSQHSQQHALHIRLLLGPLRAERRTLGELQAYETQTVYKEATNKRLAQKERLSLLY